MTTSGRQPRRCGGMGCVDEEIRVAVEAGAEGDQHPGGHVRRGQVRGRRGRRLRRDAAHVPVGGRGSPLPEPGRAPVGEVQDAASAAQAGPAAVQLRPSRLEAVKQRPAGVAGVCRHWLSSDRSWPSLATGAGQPAIASGAFRISATSPAAATNISLTIRSGRKRAADLVELFGRHGRRVRRPAIGRGRVPV